jgi:hypothetical protein
LFDALPKGAYLDLIVETPEVHDAIKGCADLLLHGWGQKVYCTVSEWINLMEVWKQKCTQTTVREFEEHGQDSDCIKMRSLAVFEHCFPLNLIHEPKRHDVPLNRNRMMYSGTAPCRSRPSGSNGHSLTHPTTVLADTGSLLATEANPEVEGVKGDDASITPAPIQFMQLPMARSIEGGTRHLEGHKRFKEARKSGIPEEKDSVLSPGKTRWKMGARGILQHTLLQLWLVKPVA